MSHESTSLSRRLTYCLALGLSLGATGVARAQSDMPPSASQKTPPSAPVNSAAAPPATDQAAVGTPTDQPPPVEWNPDAITISATPYLWASGVSGTVTDSGVSASFNESFSEIVKSLDIAFMLHVEVGWRRLFLYSDFEYIGLSSTTDINQPLITSANLPVLLSSIQANAPTLGSGPLAQALLQAQGDLALVQSQLQMVGSEVRNALAMMTPEQRTRFASLALERLRSQVPNRYLISGSGASKCGLTVRRADEMP